MSLGKRLIGSTLLSVLLLSTTVNVVQSYIPSGRDTKVPEEHYSYDIKDVSNYEKITENDNFTYYFKENRDVIAIYDKRNNYTWTTGLDLPFPKDVENACKEVSKNPSSTLDEMLAICVPLEENLNAIYTGIANSLLVVEYFDSQRSIKRISSAAEKNVSSKLLTVNNDETKRVLEVKLSGSGIPALTIKLRLNFTDKGITYEIKDTDITGKDQGLFAAILLSPFLGASGGAVQYFDPIERKYDSKNLIKKNAPSGYVVVPDGPGALIRFEDNSSSLKSYVGDVYGEDPADRYNYIEEDGWGMIPVKNPTLPVFGIVHGDDTQAAFIAYATSGDEFMQIVATPEENTTYYTWAYPRFVYNNEYYKVYNQKGWGYYTVKNERNHFDLKMNYDFLSGDGSGVGEANQGYAASYVGMALNYRQHLLDTNTIREKAMAVGDIPLRLDFIMSDSKKSVLGYENVIVTTAKDVRDILNDIQSSNIKNINSGLYGWQNGGITLGRPYATDWNNAIGSYWDYRNLIQDMNDLGIDISFAQDYVNINGVQVDLKKDSTTHINKWYPNNILYFESFAPIQEFYFARPTTSSEWAIRQNETFYEMGVASSTIEGISTKLVSDYRENEVVSLTQAKTIMKETFEKLSEEVKINATSPNLYVLNSIDRILQMDVFSSQNIIETDTIPFVQLVLQGTMELYANYSNFSFYTTADALRMIDYNVYPSFIVSKQPSYHLSKTNSMEFYSTEYKQYKPIIERIYQMVNPALQSVQNARWIGREVLQVGFVVNTYDNGTKIVINYTEEDLTYGTEIIKAESYAVLGGM